MVKFIGAENRKEAVRGLEEGEMQNCFSMCIKYLLCRVNKFQRSVVQHSTLTIQNCALQIMVRGQISYQVFLPKRRKEGRGRRKDTTNGFKEIFGAYGYTHQDVYINVCNFCILLCLNKEKKMNPVQIYCSTDFHFDASEGGRGSELTEFFFKSF